MTAQVEQDRRRAPRIPLLIRVECRTPSTYVLANCEKISETGILVKVRQTFEVAETVTLRFMLPPVATGAAVQTRGIIARAKPGEYMAMEFIGLRPPFSEAIAKYVARDNLARAGFDPQRLGF